MTEPCVNLVPREPTSGADGRTDMEMVEITWFQPIDQNVIDQLEQCEKIRHLIIEQCSDPDGLLTDFFCGCNDKQLETISVSNAGFTDECWKAFFHTIQGMETIRMFELQFCGIPNEYVGVPPRAQHIVIREPGLTDAGAMKLAESCRHDMKVPLDLLTVSSRMLGERGKAAIRGAAFSRRYTGRIFLPRKLVF